SVGFLLKLALGFIVFRVKPEVRMVDFYGFGYLLPTLIAVKIWNKERIAIVLMPALQVSLLAFVSGSALGFGLAALDRRIAAAAEAPRRRRPLDEAESISWSLLEGDSAPAGITEDPWQGQLGAASLAALDIAEDVGMGKLPADAALARAERLGIRL